MEVKRGYKQTEVGVIPEDWEVKRLGDIATIATGNTPPTRYAANYGDEFLFVSGCVCAARKEHQYQHPYPDILARPHTHLPGAFTRTHLKKST